MLIETLTDTVELLPIIILTFVNLIMCYGACEQKSVTTASGTHAPSGDYCRNQLIFEDNFDELNFRKWQHEISLTGSAVSIHC